MLRAFHDGGAGLIWIWYAFMLCAIALVPLAIAMAFARPDWRASPITSIGGAVSGSLAGITQAVGLSRWVFAVPALSRMQVNPGVSEATRDAIDVVYEMLNLWGGVAIGEHIGQMLTCLWVLHVVLDQIRSGEVSNRIAATLGLAAILGIGFGLGEGLATGLGVPGDLFSLGTIAGYLVFSLWLMMTGVLFLKSERSA